MKSKHGWRAKWCGVAVTCAAMVAGCGGGERPSTSGCDQPDNRARCAVAAPGGKADGFDVCAEMGWYDDADGYCDDPGHYCALPDPDCGPEPDECGDTLASSGWSWDGDPGHGCDVEREVLGAKLARDGIALPFRPIDVTPLEWSWDTGRPQLGLLRSAGDAHYLLTDDDLERNAIDFDHEWIAFVAYYSPGELDDSFSIEAVRQYGYRIEVAGTLLTDPPGCHTPGVSRHYAVVAFRRPSLATGELELPERRLWVSHHYRSCDGWPVPGSIELPGEGEALTLPGAIGTPSSADDLTAVYRGELAAPALTPWGMVGANQSVAYSFVAAAGEKIELFAYAAIPDLSYNSHKLTLAPMLIFGPIDQPAARAPLAVSSEISRDATSARLVAPSNGRYLLVFQPQWSGPTSCRIELTHRRSTAPSRYTLQQALHLVGRAYREGWQAVGQSWTDAAVVDLDADGLDDLLLLGAGFGSSSGFGDAASRWITVMEQQPDGTLRTGRSFPHMPPVPYDPGYRNNVRLAVGDIDSDGDPDVAVYGEAGLRLLRNDGAGGLALDLSALPADLPGNLGVGIAMTDFDGDGRLDLLAGSELLWQQADGSFTIGERLPLPRYWTIGDITGDGLDDVISLEHQGLAQNERELRVFPHGVAPAIEYDFRYPGSQLVSTGRILVADLEGDGLNELLVRGMVNNQRVLWVVHQQPGGTLDAPSSIEDLVKRAIPHDRLWLAQDGDGNGEADLVGLSALHMRMAASLAPAASLQPWSYTGTHAFTAPALVVVGAAMGDLNHDGCDDVVLLGRWRSASVHYGVGCH